MENFLQLLNRYRRSVIGLALLFILLAAACYPLSRLMIDDLAGLLPGPLYQTMVAEALWARLMLCLAAAAAVTAFAAALCVRKALGRRMPGLIILGLALFAAGVTFARLVILPPAIRMLSGILGNGYQLHITMAGYISFCLLFLLIIGLLFEEPLLVQILYRAGLVQADGLRKRRKAVYLLVLIAMAVLTPTQDAVTLLLVMLPFAGLYELSILWLALLARRELRRVNADG